MLSGGTWPAVPDDEEEEELLLELLEELELLETPLEDEDDEEDDDDEELLTPDDDDEEEDDELLLELEEGSPLLPSSVPPQATKVSAKRHELAIVTGRRQSTNVFIEDIFTYLFLVTHIVS